MVAVREDGAGSATRVWRIAVGSAWSVRRAADPGRLGIEATRADETMLRAVAVFVGHARSEAERTVTTGRRWEAADSAFGGLSPGRAIR